MENFNNEINQTKSDLSGAASTLMNEGKKCATEMYEEGCNKMAHAEESAKQSLDNLMKMVQEKPLSSVLIAGGIGFLLSRVLK